MQSEQINEISKALAEAQVELTNPQKNKTAKAGSYSYKYADIADVLDCVRPVLAKHGIAVSQPTIVDGEILIVQTRLSHTTGQWMTSDYPVCRINGDHQKMGAALTYARRYALTSMVGVAAEEDTDGQGAAEAASNAKVRNPKTGRMVNPKSSSQAKARGDWEMFQQELAECETVVSLDRLRREYAEVVYERWPAAWIDQAGEAFEKRQAELTAESPKEAFQSSIDMESAKALQEELIERINECEIKEDLARLRDQADFRSALARLPAEYSASVKGHGAARMQALPSGAD